MQDLFVPCFIVSKGQGCRLEPQFGVVGFVVAAASIVVGRFGLGFKIVGGPCVPPVGEIVWFRNPGAALDPNTEWDENIIVGSGKSVPPCSSPLSGDEGPDCWIHKFSC